MQPVRMRRRKLQTAKRAYGNRHIAPGGTAHMIRRLPVQGPVAMTTRNMSCPTIHVTTSERKRRGAGQRGHNQRQKQQTGNAPEFSQTSTPELSSRNLDPNLFRKPLANFLG